MILQFLNLMVLLVLQGLTTHTGSAVGSSESATIHFNVSFSQRLSPLFQLDLRCTTTSDCGKGQACYREKCICLDQDDMFYDEFTNTCYTLVDGPCFLAPIVGVEKICVQDAVCVPQNSMTGECQCEAGSPPNEYRLCGDLPTLPTTTTDISISTSSSSPISTSSEDSTMTSTSATTEVPPEEGTYPPGLIGQACDLKKNKGCITNAICVDLYCVCKNKYVPDEDFKNCKAFANLLSSSFNFFFLALVSGTILPKLCIIPY